MRPVHKDVYMFTRKLIHLHHLCAEFTPIIFHEIIGLEDNDLPRIVLRAILSSTFFEQVVTVKLSERRR